jgi:hypothetical protein
VALGDVNGDGKPDLVVANEGDSTVSVLLNTTVLPAATFTPAFTQTTFATGRPSAVAMADINGDGKPDLIVANIVDNTVSIFLNTTPPGAATPSFATQQTFATGPNPFWVAVADVNGDGKLDLLFADRGNGTVSVLLNTTTPGAATASFATVQTFAVGAASNSAPQSVTVADINGDGRPDLVVCNHNDDTVSVLLNTTTTGATTASFATQQIFATVDIPYTATVGDVNGDGKPDLIVADENIKTVEVLLNTTPTGASTASFATAQTFVTGNGPTVAALADVNGDGKPDLVVTNIRDNTVSVLRNTTTPGATTVSFATQQTFGTGAGPRSVAVGDVTGDGKPDIIVANNSDSTVSVLRNTTTPGATTASFATQQAFATGASPFGMALGDVNGDGRPDILTANNGDNTVSVLLNTPVTIPGNLATGTITESAGGTLPFTDSFTQADGSDLSASWTEQVGDNDILSNKANGESGLNLATLTGISAANVVVQADVTLPTGQDSQVGLVARYSGSGDTADMYWGFLFRLGTTTRAQIYRHTNAGNAWTLLADAAVPGNPLSGKLRFEVIDSSLQLFLNGALVASAVDTSPQAINSPGSVGTRSIVNTQFDNFSAKAVFTDTFTQGNGSSLNSPPWTTQSGSFTVQSNAAVSGPGVNLATLTGLSEADVHVESDVTLVSGTLIGLVARDSGADYYTGALIDSGGITYAAIYRHAAGGFSLLSSVTAVAGNPKTGKLRFDVAGNSLTLSLNGMMVASVSDAALTTGSTGMLSIGGGTFDNFREIPRS